MDKYDKTGEIVIGLDVHKETVVAAVLPPGADQVRETVTLAHTPKEVTRFVARLAASGPLSFVYEAGPCGYELHRQLTALGHRCAVIVPALTPVRPGDRVKTDRRDAEKLARWYRAGELTEIRVPTQEMEAARDLVRTREDALADRQSAQRRLATFLLRHGRVYRETKPWGLKHWEWLQAQRFEWVPLQHTFEMYVRAVEEAQARLSVLDQHVQDLSQLPAYQALVAALRCLKGIDTLSALTLIVEAQDFRRFASAPAFMGFAGLGVSEYSSGAHVRRGGITKAGNAHLRRVLIEAAWSQRHGRVVSSVLAARRAGASTAVLAIARKAQARLHRKYWRLVSRGKSSTVAVAAVARELAGFVWALAHQVPAAA